MSIAGLEGLLIGRVLGERYVIERVIGRGGMGAVYAAQDLSLERPVAVKVISAVGAHAAATERLRARFRKEARAAAQIRHANVVTVHDFGTDTHLGLDFLVMELLDGEDLQSRLERGPLPVAIALSIIQQAAQGLAAGHRAGLVHRDVKPGNLFLSPGEGDRPWVRVLDYGIAQLDDSYGTATHLTLFGSGPLSPGFASPEQIRGVASLTPASDVFSLAMTACLAISGERAFSPEDLVALARGDSDPTPRLPGDPAVPPAARAALRQALDPDPAARFPDALAFAEALGRAGSPPAERPLSLLPAARVEPADRPSRPVRIPAPVKGPSAFVRIALLVGIAALAAATQIARESDLDVPRESIPADEAIATDAATPARAGVASPAATGAPTPRSGYASTYDFAPSPEDQEVARRPSPRTSAIAERMGAAPLPATEPPNWENEAGREKSPRQPEPPAARAPAPKPSSRSVPEIQDQERVVVRDYSGIDGVDRGGSEEVPIDVTVATRRPTLRSDLPSMVGRRYPPLLRDAGISGYALVKFVLRRNGRVDPASVFVISATHDAFGEAATRIVEDLRFTPAEVDGTPVSVLMTQRVSFQPQVPKSGSPRR